MEIFKRQAIQKSHRPGANMREEADRLIHSGVEKEGRKIALVGTADSGELAPIDDPSWEIWGVSAKRKWITRATRWYEVHRLAGHGESWVNIWKNHALSFNDETDIYMHYPEPGFGKVFPYPVDHIMQRFGTYFLTSSFAWMMAHAIDEMCPAGEDPVPGEIAIYGVDMESGSEYTQQRAGFHHFIDLARILNVRITRLASSGISYEPIPYPMSQDDPLLNKLDKRQVHARDKLVDLVDVIPRTELMIAQNEAVIAALKQHSVGGETIEQLEKETTQLTATLRIMEKDMIMWSTAEKEQQWLRDYLTS